jgi:hypothetical protein
VGTTAPAKTERPDESSPIADEQANRQSEGVTLIRVFPAYPRIRRPVTWDSLDKWRRTRRGFDYREELPWWEGRSSRRFDNSGRGKGVRIVVEHQFRDRLDFVPVANEYLTAQRVANHRSDWANAATSGSTMRQVQGAEVWCSGYEGVRCIALPRSVFRYAPDKNRACEQIGTPTTLTQTIQATKSINFIRLKPASRPNVDVVDKPVVILVHRPPKCVVVIETGFIIRFTPTQSTTGGTAERHRRRTKAVSDEERVGQGR